MKKMTKMSVPYKPVGILCWVLPATSLAFVLILSEGLNVKHSNKNNKDNILHKPKCQTLPLNYCAHS